MNPFVLPYFIFSWKWSAGKGFLLKSCIPLMYSHLYHSCLWFPGIFRSYKMGKLVRNGLKAHNHVPVKTISKLHV